MRYCYTLALSFLIINTSSAYVSICGPKSAITKLHNTYNVTCFQHLNTGTDKNNINTKTTIREIKGIRNVTLEIKNKVDAIMKMNHSNMALRFKCKTGWIEHPKLIVCSE